MLKIDLHIHSVYSDDGEFSVKEILERCKAAGIATAAITDHNSVRGVASALALGPQMGVKVVPGVELDCVHLGKNLHLLGYGFAHTFPVFAEIERNVMEQEKNAAEQKIALIKNETGIPLNADEVLSAAADGVVTGELIAEILLQKENANQYEVLLPYLPGGARSDNPYVNFYWDYFSAGKPAYVPMQYISLGEGISLLHAAGGIAVLAHPGQSLPGEYAFLRQLMETGIDGVEAYSSYHSSADAAYFTDMTLQRKLFITCGSDFHGKTKPAISLCGHRADAIMPAIADAFERACGI